MTPSADPRVPTRVPSCALYVSLPFCGVSVSTEPGTGTRSEYLDRIVTDLELSIAGLGVVEVPVVYVGGGTPSELGPGPLDALLAAIDRGLPNCPTEWTIEVNPESLTEELIDLLGSRGVNRISYGLVSNEDDVLKRLGRPHNAAAAVAGLALLADRWLIAGRRLNVDLLVGVTGQGMDHTARAIDRTVSAGADHVTLLLLDVMESPPGSSEATTPADLALPPGDATRQWGAARDRLISSGYAQYDQVSFARPHARSRYAATTARLEPYLGIGLGAGSWLPGADGSPIMGDMPGTLEGMLRAPAGLQAATWQSVAPAEALLLMAEAGLRSVDGLDHKLVVERFGRPLGQLIPATLEDFSDRVIMDGGGARTDPNDHATITAFALAAGAEAANGSPALRARW